MHGILSKTKLHVIGEFENARLEFSRKISAFLLTDGSAEFLDRRWNLPPSINLEREDTFVQRRVGFTGNAVR